MRKQRANRVEAAGIETSAVAHRWALLAEIRRRFERSRNARLSLIPRWSRRVRVGGAPFGAPVSTWVRASHLTRGFSILIPLLSPIARAALGRTGCAADVRIGGWA